MARLVVLDSGPLGCDPASRESPDRPLPRLGERSECGRGVVLALPEIADYEVRRELLRIRAGAGSAG